MEQIVALAPMSTIITAHQRLCEPYLAIIPPVASRFHQPIILLDVPYVEQFLVLEPKRTASLNVRKDIVQLTKSLRELNVQLVVQLGVAEDYNTILVCVRLKVLTNVFLLTLLTAFQSSWKTSSGIGREKSTPDTSAPKVG